MKKRLLQGLFGCVVAVGCVDHNRVNDRCEWSESETVIDLDKARDRRHLGNDVELAEELGIRYGDSFREREGIVEERQRREQCTVVLFTPIARLHHLMMEEV